ncbi:hypothetical protein ACN2XU_14515 [Primorskyibacter sp. 2E107]
MRRDLRTRQTTALDLPQIQRYKARMMARHLIIIRITCPAL